MSGHAFGNQRINNFREWVPAFHLMGPEIDRLTYSAACAFIPWADSPQPPPFFWVVCFVFWTWAHVAQGGLELLTLSPLPPKLWTTLPLHAQILPLAQPSTRVTTHREGPGEPLPITAHTPLGLGCRREDT